MRQHPLLTLVLADGSGSLAPSVQTVNVTQYEDIQLPFAFKRANGAAADATGGTFIFTARRTSFDRTDPPPLSKQGQPVNFAVGAGFFQAGAADTGPLEDTDPNAPYSVDVDFIDNVGLYGTPGTRWQVMPASPMFVLPAIGIPGTPVTPSEGVPPLGQGFSLVRAFALSDVPTLSGLPAAQDGVTLIAGNRLGLVAQTDLSENGPWVVSTGFWLRPLDFADGKRAAAFLMGAQEGTTKGAAIYRCTKAGPLDVVGTDDLTFLEIGAGGSGRAPAVGVDGAVDVESPVGILGARRRLTYDDIDPAFTGSLSGSFAAARALGSPLVNPQFTFTANAALSAVAGDVTVTDEVDTRNIVPPTSPFGYGAPGLLPARSYVSSVINATKSWDLKLTKLGGAPVIHRFASVQFQPNVYFGKSSSLGPYNAAFIAALAAPVLASGSNRDITTTTGAGEFVFYCFPTVFGGVPGNFIDVATNFPFGVTKVASAVSVDNGFGVLVSIDVWRSDFPNLGLTTMRKQ